MVVVVVVMEGLQCPHSCIYLISVIHNLFSLDPLSLSGSSAPAPTPQIPHSGLCYILVVYVFRLKRFIRDVEHIHYLVPYFSDIQNLPAIFHVNLTPIHATTTHPPLTVDNFV